MKIRNAILAGVLVAGVPAGTVAVATAASAATCTTTHTDKWTHASTGSWSHTITTKRTCGHSYTSHEWRAAHSYTGAHSSTTTDEVGTTSPSHYREHLVRYSWSKAGKLTVTVENITK